LLLAACNRVTEFGPPASAPSPAPPPSDAAATVAPPTAAPADGAAVVAADSAMDPDPGAGVSIEGTFAPRDRVVVFLHLGHSNMAGRATGPAALKPFFYDTDPHLWAYARGAMWRPAKEPTAGDMGTGNAAGPGMAILRTALAAAPDRFFVSIGHGQSGLEEGDCLSYRKNGLLYETVMGPARELKGRVTFGGLFTMLGITEHHLSADQQRGFSDCMKGLADDVRGDLGEPDLPFMVGDYELGATRADVAPSTDFAKLIIAQIKLIPGKTARSAVIPTDGLPMEDNHHYNMAGHKLWAERGMKLLVDHGWAPWAAP